jgi:acyl carrier protein
MTQASIFQKLTQVLRDIFDNEALVVTPELTARAVEGWDSLSNVRLFIELEHVFGVRFSATEISSLKNVGQLAELLERKLAHTKS